MPESICSKGTDQGLVFPASEWEHDIPQVVRVFLYGFALLYFFMGISMIADIFMEAIESVTSARRSKLGKDGRYRTVKVWNETVATLSLMALGSSAPEIFLSVIDVVKGEFYFGSSIGASTIVGSAAFNLFVIVAVCIMIIPLGEARLIRNMPAFYVTAIFSMAAYMWMGFILLYSSPNIVDVWEAVVTFLLLPVLLLVSFKVDQGELDGILRTLKIISAYDQVIAAEPKQKRKRRTTQRGSRHSEADGAFTERSFVIVWHSRTGGWSAEKSETVEEAKTIFSRIPRALSRAIYDPDGQEVQSWFANGDWSNLIRGYYLFLKRGHYVKFLQETLHVKALEEEQKLQVTVSRRGTLNEPLSCDYHTEAMSAVPGFDFEACAGTLEFASGEGETTIEISICGKPRWRRPVSFIIVLDPGDDESVRFDPLDDGGTQAAIMTVVIDPVSDYEKYSGFAKRVENVINCGMVVQGCKDWASQLKSVPFVEVDEDDEEATVGCKDVVMHIIFLPWKVYSCLLPPTTLFGGWLTFWMTLICLGLQTACVSDLAELFGCVIEAPTIVTAITFVALGTSMPDLFASLTAAKEDPTADASVVNVTGSNSVNVFLGLGLPWSLAAIYWAAKSSDSTWSSTYPDLAAARNGSPAFVVESSNLGQSVVVYIACSTGALVLLHLRRKWVGAELGGPRNSKYAISGTFIVYWLLFVVLVSWRVMRWGRADYSATEQAVVYALSVALGGGVTVATLVIMRRERSAGVEANFCSTDRSSEYTSASIEGPIGADDEKRCSVMSWGSDFQQPEEFEVSPDIRTEVQVPRESSEKRVESPGGYRGKGVSPCAIEFANESDLQRCHYVVC